MVNELYSHTNMQRLDTDMQTICYTYVYIMQYSLKHMYISKIKISVSKWFSLEQLNCLNYILSYVIYMFSVFLHLGAAKVLCSSL